jgi:hypothetical protein
MDDHTGEPLGEEEVNGRHYDKVGSSRRPLSKARTPKPGNPLKKNPPNNPHQPPFHPQNKHQQNPTPQVTQLQRLFFRHWPQLKELSLSNCATLERRDVLARALSDLSDPELRHLAVDQLRLVSNEDGWLESRAFLEEVVVSHYERRKSQRAAINAMPLYPSEAVLWDEAQVGRRGWMDVGGGWGRLGVEGCALAGACECIKQCTLTLKPSPFPPHHGPPATNFTLQNFPPGPLRPLQRRRAPRPPEAQPPVPHGARLFAAQLPPLPAGGRVRGAVVCGGGVNVMGVGSRFDAMEPSHTHHPPTTSNQLTDRPTDQPTDQPPSPTNQTTNRPITPGPRGHL